VRCREGRGGKRRKRRQACLLLPPASFLSQRAREAEESRRPDQREFEGGRESHLERAAFISFSLQSPTTTPSPLGPSSRLTIPLVRPPPSFSLLPCHHRWRGEERRGERLRRGEEAGE